MFFVALFALTIGFVSLDSYFFRSSLLAAQVTDFVMAQQLPTSNFGKGSAVSTQMAYHESYGFFDYIPDTIWKEMKSYANSFPSFKYPKKPMRGREQKHIWFQNNLEPIINCPKMQRIGGLGDGPKWVCDPTTIAQKPGGCLIYSVGSNGNYLFEEAWVQLSNKTCEIHTFDFGNYARKDDAKKKNIHYHRWGLGSEEQARNSPNSQGQTFKSFQQIVKELGHENRTIDLFKIDCEGCEFSTYKDWLSSDNIRQINIEVHVLPDNAEDFYKSFRENHFAMYSKEFNAIASAKCLEYSFIKLHPDFWEV